MPEHSITFKRLESKMQMVAKLTGVKFYLEHTPHVGYKIERMEIIGDTKRGPYRCVSCVTKKEAWEWLDGFSEGMNFLLEKIKLELNQIRENNHDGNTRSDG